MPNTNSYLEIGDGENQTIRYDVYKGYGVPGTQPFLKPESWVFILSHLIKCQWQHIEPVARVGLLYLLRNILPYVATGLAVTNRQAVIMAQYAFSEDENSSVLIASALYTAIPVLAKISQEVAVKGLLVLVWKFIIEKACGIERIPVNARPEGVDDIESQNDTMQIVTYNHPRRTDKFLLQPDYWWGEKFGRAALHWLLANVLVFQAANYIALIDSDKIFAANKDPSAPNDFKGGMYPLLALIYVLIAIGLKMFAQEGVVKRCVLSPIYSLGTNCSRRYTQTQGYNSSNSGRSLRYMGSGSSGSHSSLGQKRPLLQTDNQQSSTPNYRSVSTK